MVACSYGPIFTANGTSQTASLIGKIAAQYTGGKFGEWIIRCVAKKMVKNRGYDAIVAFLVRSSYKICFFDAASQ